MAAEPRTWISKDYHIHESYSSDAPHATPEKYCEVAERRGIDEICFTTHLVLTGPDIKHGISPEKITRYLQDIDTAQEKTDVTLRSGLEIDWFPEVEREIENILDEHLIDYALGCLHYVKGIDIGSRKQAPSFFKEKNLMDALDIYFEEMKRAIESGLFDVIAHPDYFRKYLGLTHEMPVAFEDYGSKILDAFDSIKRNNVGIEVNSSGFRHGINDVYPIKGFIAAARKAGVKTVTIGSDSHTVVDLGRDTIRAAQRLQMEGYDYICIFNKRKRKRVKLTKVMRAHVPK
jgi:histidinol-phosphatase (PHP family)